MEQDKTKPASTKIHKHPLFIALILAGVLATALCTFFFAISLTRGYIGAELALVDGKWIVQEVDPSGLAFDSKIEAEDDVEEFNNEPIASISEEFITEGVVRPRLVQQLKVKTSQGGEISVSVANATVPDATTRETITIFVIAITFLAIGFFVFIKKPLRRPSTTLYIATMTSAIALSTIIAAERNIAVAFELQTTTGLLLPWIVAHLFLVFPARKRVRVRNPLAEYLVYLPPLILLILLGSLGYRGSQLAPWFRSAMLISMIVGFVFALGNLIHNYLSSTFVRIKQQVKIILAGMTLALLPIIVLMILSD